MKTAVRHTLFLAILGGLLSALGAIVFLPSYAADPGLLALVLGSLAAYALAAMAMVEYSRSRATTMRRMRNRVVVARPVVVPMPARRRDVERIAA